MAVDIKIKTDRKNRKKRKEKKEDCIFCPHHPLLPMVARVIPQVSRVLLRTIRILLVSYKRWGVSWWTFQAQDNESHMKSYESSSLS